MPVATALLVPILPAKESGVPGLQWCRLLGRWERLESQLASLAALASTLGGGHFMCRQLGSARRMALAQQRICLLAGRYGAAMRCELHLVYGEAQAGRLRASARRLRRLMRAVRGPQVVTRFGLGNNEVDEIGAMCVGAASFLRGLR